MPHCASDYFPNMDSTAVKLRASLPAHLLNAAYLAGKTPFRACKMDPRISYSLYIPPKQYAVVHKALQGGSLAATDRLPLIVYMHGTRRAAAQCRDLLVDYAEQHGCAILTPLFPAALDGPLDLDSYKKLRGKTIRSDEVLLSIVEEVAGIWPGIATERFTLMGVSGGGQFTHRFLYLHPERLQRVIVGAPGRITTISDRNWPEGLADVEQVFDGGSVDIAAVRGVRPILIIVGEDDHDDADLLELKSWFDKAVGKTLDAELQVPLIQSRVDHCRELQRNWEEHGIEAELIVVPRVAHSYLGLAPSMIEWLDRTRRSSLATS